jgi:hypothetical protein
VYRNHQPVGYCIGVGTDAMDVVEVIAGWSSSLDITTDRLHLGEEVAFDLDWGDMSGRFAFAL